MKKYILHILLLLNSAAFATALTLEDGYYKVSTIEKRGRGDEKFQMLVQTDINDASKKYVVMLPKKVLKGYGTGLGYFYQARSVKNGSALMLAPIGIDLSGNFVIHSEVNARSPIALLSKKFIGEKFDYVLQGRNGALENELYKIERKSGRQRYPNLTNRPSNGYFVVGSKRKGVELVVNENMLSIFGQSYEEKDFEFIDINGSGAFSGLSVSEWDSMAEQEVGYESISKIAMFFETYEGREQSLLVATPGFRPGQYRMDVFKSGDISWVSKILINLFE